MKEFFELVVEYDFHHSPEAARELASFCSRNALAIGTAMNFWTRSAPLVLK